MGYTYYNPLTVWLDPASIADVVSYMQKYLSENPIKDTEEINQIIAEYIAAHPELIGGVQSVNGETGVVVLTASDIETTETTTIQEVLTSLSSQISSITASVEHNAFIIEGLENPIIANSKNGAVTLTVEQHYLWLDNDGIATKKYDGSGSNARTAEVSVVAGESYLVGSRNHTDPQFANLYGIIFADANNEIVETDYMTDVSGTTINYYERVPVGASKMFINSYGSNPSLIKLSNEPIWENRTIFYIANGEKPSFTYRYTKDTNAQITVTLPNRTMGIVKPNGTTVSYSSTTTPRSWDVPSGQALVWNLDTNTISVKTRANAAGNDILLFIHLYGYAFDGLFKSFYDEIYGEGLRYVEEYVGIPWEYDTAYIAGKIDEVREKQLDAGLNMFAFITDTHNKTDRQHQDSPKMLQTLARSTGLNKTICGGDWIYATGTEAEMYQQLWDQIHAYKSYVSPFSKVYNVRGNHDIHITNSGTTYTLTDQQVFNTMFADMENNVVYNSVDPLGMYYYFDSGDIRYMCINCMQEQQTGESSRFERQLAFFTSAIQSAPSDKLFVFVSHIPMLTSQSENADYAQTTFIPLIETVKTRTVGVFTGHTHEDNITISNGVVYVVSQADCRVDRTANMRTTNAGSFDVVCINKGTSTCDLIRIGQGNNRSFTFGSNPSISE